MNVDREPNHGDHLDAELLDHAKVIEQARAAYAASWPRYCRACDGWGATCYEYDPSPPGAIGAGDLPTDCDPCEECSIRSICARCGLTVDPCEGASPAHPCPHCGHVDGRDGKPRY
jgi:hypothetical protein